MNKISYKFFLRPVNNKYQLYIRIIYNQKKIEKSLKVDIDNPENFDGLCVKGKTPDAIKANILIEQWKKKLSEIIFLIVVN